MIDEVAAWLNGRREYHSGAVLYSVYGSNEQLKQLFLNDSSAYNVKRLFEELRSLYYQHEESQERKEKKHVPVVKTKVSSADPDLIAACDTKAKNLYKELMNKRAVLFSLCRSNEWEDENSPEKIKERGKLAFEVLEMNYAVDKAYEELAYVKEHGTLPAKLPPVSEKYALLPDALVKHEMENLRINIHKTKKKPPTPERIIALKEHEENFKKLQARWDLLNEK